MVSQVLLFLAGLFLLYLGAELLVRGATQLAYMARVKPFIIGVTVVAFGTSSPEIIVSFIAAFSNQIDVAIGNIVGSNIANIGLVLGISALLVPVPIVRKVVQREFWWMIVASVCFLLFAMNGVINTIEGLAMFAGIVAFTGMMVYSGMKQRESNSSADIPAAPGWMKNFGRTTQILINGGQLTASIFILMWASELTIDAATAIARSVGVSEMVIGLSLVAFGTSLPELATAIISTIKKENEILVGNIVGSNLFNLLFVGGGVASFFDIPVNQQANSFDLPVMLAFSIILIPSVYLLKKVSRWYGLILLMLYVAYIFFILNTH